MTRIKAHEVTLVADLCDAARPWPLRWTQEHMKPEHFDACRALEYVPALVADYRLATADLRAARKRIAALESALGLAIDRLEANFMTREEHALAAELREDLP